MAERFPGKFHGSSVFPKAQRKAKVVHSLCLYMVSVSLVILDCSFQDVC